jgi:adenylate cyclase
VNFQLEYSVNDRPITYKLEKEVVTVGKLRGSDMQFDDKTISRTHCKFVKHDGGVKLVDCQSTNGTYVNGERIREKVLLEGDSIAIGRTILKFSRVEESRELLDDSNQKISMVVPLEEEIKVKDEKAASTDDLNFLTTLTELGKQLIASGSMENTFQTVGESIFEFLKPMRLFIFFHDESQGDLSLKFARSITGERVEKINISKTIAMKAIREKVAILSSNTKDDARFEEAKSVILYGITSAMSAPIWTKNSIYGLIYVDTMLLDRIFTQRDLKILSTIANFTGLSIETLNTLEKLEGEKKLRSRLERYHSPAVVSRIMECNDSNTMELMQYKELEATVLFMDIVGFTTKAENMNPVEVGIFLNSLFTEMTDIIFDFNGTLDKYIGDALMAVFGVPFETENHAELAIQAALSMQKKAQEITMENGDPIQIRIGINTGKLISGDFGSPKRFDYTVLGNAVNIASRLEATIAKPGDIIVSGATQSRTRDVFQFDALGEQKLQGISKPLDAFKVLNTVARVTEQ